MLFDFGFVWLAMVAIAIANVKNPELLVSLTTHGLSLATGTFLINTWSGFYHASPSRSVAPFRRARGVRCVACDPAGLLDIQSRFG